MQDLWLSIQLYFCSANSVDSILLMYHAFSKMALRKLREITATMDELLHTTLRTFSTEQFSAWEDCSSALAALGGYRDILLLQTKPLNPSQSQDAQVSDDAERSLRRVSGAGTGTDGGSSNKASPIVSVRKATTGSFDSADVSRAGADSDSDGEPDVYESSGRNNASVFRSNFFSRQAPNGYIAFHGRLSYCTTTRAEAANGTLDFTEHSMWTEVTVLLTYNRILHIMHVPQANNVNDVDDLKYSREAHIMSVNVRNVLVKPFIIAKEGYGDAFEVLLAGSGSKKMGMLGSLSSSSKEITALIFLAPDSLLMRSWMRAISNPFTDPTKNPPDSPTPAATNSAPLQGMSITTTASTSSGGAAGSDPDGFTFGGEDMVSGTNSLREAALNGKLSNASTPTKAGASIAADITTATGPDGFIAYTGADAVVGVNALRKASNAEAMGTSTPTAAKAAPAPASSAEKGSESPNTGRPAGLEGFTLYTGSDAVGGSNALRRLKKTPSGMGPGLGRSQHNVLSSSIPSTPCAAPAPSGTDQTSTASASAAADGDEADYADVYACKDEF